MGIEVQLIEPSTVVGSDLTAVGVPLIQRADALEAASPWPAMAGVSLAADLDGVWARSRGFTAEEGQALSLAAGPGQPAVVWVGLGEEPLDAERWRKAGAALVRAAGRSGTAVLVLPTTIGDVDRPHGEVLSLHRLVAAVVEGAVLAAYRFDEQRSEPSPPAIERLQLVGPSSEEARSGLAAGLVAANATCFARDLVNRPPSQLTPRILAEQVEDRLRGVPGVVVEVWSEHRIEDERMGGLLGVNRGSVEPPRFVRATYHPVDATSSAGRPPRVALVGKGITFDSGGLSLKTAEGMTTMKTDMGGAAAVLGALWACATEGLDVEVTAYAPLTENMPSGSAIKPGDVLTIRNGATIEVLNTDAEGRLVLADALSLAADDGVDLIVDVATLTGAAIVALGRSIAAVLGNDDSLVRRVQQAGVRAGEPSWPLPLPGEYRKHIDSEIADMRNIGRPGEAGSIAAALLLARFVGDVPWAHLDIAGPARSSDSEGYQSKGGTGFAVRTLLELLRDVAAPEE